MLILRNEILSKTEHFDEEQCQQIESFFVNEQLDGEAMYAMKRKQFVQRLMEYVGDEPDHKKLNNHGLIVLYKTFFRMDLSEVLPTNDTQDSLNAVNASDSTNNISEMKVESGDEPLPRNIPKIISVGTSQKSLCSVRSGDWGVHRVETPSVRGHRFWYWSSGKNEKCFVPQRFASLKEEVLQHLSASKWDEVYNKTIHLQKSQIIKSIRCETDKYRSSYGIAGGATLQNHHILAVTLYTDFVDLSLRFTSSFTKQFPEEKGTALVIRHSAWAHWSKYLREIVECFGTKMRSTKTDTFYRVVDERYSVQSITTRLYRPTSTTTQLTVARLFAPDEGGSILELEAVRTGMELTFLNCALFSPYSAMEGERLFIGGARSLRFCGLRVLSEHRDYRLFMSAIAVMDEILHSARFKRNKRNRKSQITQMTKQSAIRWRAILRPLCRHRISVLRGDSAQSVCYFRNKYPEDINGIFGRYCASKKRVRIALKWLNLCDPALKALFTEGIGLVSSPNSTRSANHKKTATKRVRFAPEVAVIERHSAADSKRRIRRRHTVCGLEVAMEVICGSFLFDLLPNVSVIEVMTTMDGVGYDIVRGLPGLVVAHKLDAERRPLKMDRNARKHCNSMMDMTVRGGHCAVQSVVFVENSLYQFDGYFASFYVKFILRTLDYFFESKWFDEAERERNALRDLSAIEAIIVIILKWKLMLRGNEEQTRICPQILRYFMERTSIHFNVRRARKCMEAAACLLHSKVKRLPLIHVIAAVFTECREVTVYGVKDVTASYLQSLLSSLQRLNRNKLRHCKLERIVLYQPIQVHCGGDEVERWRHKFNRSQWQIAVENIVADKSKNVIENVSMIIHRKSQIE